VRVSVASGASMPDPRASFEDAWCRHRGRLYRLCLRWLGGDRDDAEEAMSRLSVRALEDLATRRDAISNYPGWLTRFACNLCMDIHRERAAGRRAIERLVAESRGLGARRADHPETEQLRRELGRVLADALGELPPRLSEPCQRRFIHEMPYEEIAAELQLTNETVRKRIQEARDILHGKLDAYLESGASA
jgi:RNA polymerase sigma factor (sigma-70 family)